MSTIIFRGTRAEFHALIRQLPAVLAGRAPDPLGVARGVQLRLGVALLGQVQASFINLSRTLYDPATGIHWKPLKPETIARRKRSAGDRKAAGKVIRSAKAGGGKRPTQVQLYGARPTSALFDTGRLFRSLSAGVEDRPSNAPEQIFRMTPGRVIVGTKCPYASAHQNGNPSKGLPARPFFPPDKKIPVAWWLAIAKAAVRGIERAIILAASQQR